MPTMLTEEDLSLRHLPELSDYSFSFQIPTSALSKGDDLMAADNTFLEGANNNSILATPAPLSRAIAQPHPRAPHFTPRPTALESSPAHHQPRTSLPLESPSASHEYVQLQPSPITEAPISSKDSRNSEAKDPHEEERNHAHQDQEPRELRSFSSVSTATSTAILHGILSTQPTFAERSPLGSRPEVGHSELDLPQTELRSTIDNVVTFGAKQEQPGTSSLTGAQESSVGARPGRSLLTRSVRSTAGIKPPKRPTVAAGIMKSRRQTKAARTRSEGAPALSIASRAILKPPTLAEESLDPSTADKSQESNLNLSSFVSAGGAAGRLVMYSQQFMNEQNDTIGSATHGAEPSCVPETNTAQLDATEIQDIDMNLSDQQLDPRAGRVTHANIFDDQDDDRDKPLTISQLSPRKRSTRCSTALKLQDNGTTPLPPTLPVLEPMFESGGSSKKRSTASVPCQDQRATKKGRGSGKVKGGKGDSDPKVVPARATRSMTRASLSTIASAASSVLSEMGSFRGGTVVDSSNVIVKNEGCREEVVKENVVDIGHAKTELSSEIISTSGCGSFERVKGSGQPTSAKGPVKRRVEIGARTRMRRSSRLSSSANGGKSLRTRSISNSTSARGEVLRASERGRRIALVRARKEARGKDRQGGLTEQQNASEGLSSANGLKSSGVTLSTSRTRPVEFKFASELRIQARKAEGQRMTRSASSLSSSSGAEADRINKRVHPIPNFKAMHTQHNAALVHRKENTHPVLPQPFQWATEQRLKERKQFDEMVREKEREREELEEQKRREREEEEEREVRELRKRAVPKANAVPEWYRDAPKKTKDGETIGSRTR